MTEADNLPKSDSPAPEVGTSALFALGKQHLDDLARLAMSVWNELLAEWAGRARKLGKYAASHPATLRKLVQQLDERGEHEAADAIHSLVWELAMQRQRDMRDVLSSVEMGIHFRAEDAAKRANVSDQATASGKHG